jgi:hypothetical protein
MITAYDPDDLPFLSIFGAESSFLRQLARHVGNAAWFVYDMMITRPLRAFYFEGPIWHNHPPEEVCYEMTGIEARHWTSTPDNLARCQLEMERRFQSWNRTAMTTMYFAMLAFVAIKVACCCCCGGFRSSSAKMCSCDGDGRLATKAELKEILQWALRQKQSQ